MPIIEALYFIFSYIHSGSLKKGRNVNPISKIILSNFLLVAAKEKMVSHIALQNGFFQPPRYRIGTSVKHRIY